MARTKKKATRRTTRKAAAVKTQLPKGYESISGFGPSWPNDDTAVGDMLEGIVIEFGEVEQQRKRGKKIVTETVQTAKVETKDGTVFTVWESWGTRPLFEYEEGVSVAIIFDGHGEARKGRNPPKLFRIGVK